MERGNLILVSGIDGTGKSAFIRYLNEEPGLNAIGLEPTNSAVTREFKLSNYNTPVTKDFIDHRQNFYLKLQSDTDEGLRKYLDDGVNVVTSGNVLVTHLSHTVMRAVLGDEVGIPDVLSQQNECQSLKPDALVIFHAPIEVIMKRIEKRRKGGDHTENRWGFNSPFF